MTDIAAQLKAWRKARNLSQEQASAVIGVPISSIENWEQGRRAPRGLALDALTQKLNIKPRKKS